MLRCTISMIMWMTVGNRVGDAAMRCLTPSRQSSRVRSTQFVISQLNSTADYTNGLSLTVREEKPLVPEWVSF